MNTQATPGVSAPSVFQFQSNKVRTFAVDGAPWFVAKDVAEALDYTWKGIATVGHIPEEWRGVHSVQTPSAAQEMLVLSEAGLYFFLGRSDKPKALPFQKWLAGEVLPAIRKTGKYNVPNAPTAPELTLSSMDLAELIRLPHDAIVRFLTARIAKLGIASSQLTWTARTVDGQAVQVLHLTRAQCDLVTATVKGRERSAITQRWAELEKAQAPAPAPAPTTAPQINGEFIATIANGKITLSPLGKEDCIAPYSAWAGLIADPGSLLTNVELHNIASAALARIARRGGVASARAVVLTEAQAAPAPTPALPHPKPPVIGPSGKQWTDPALVEQILKGMRLRQDLMYQRVVASPDRVEELFQMNVIGERRIEDLRRLMK